jgi:hypothetical protein
MLFPKMLAGTKDVTVAAAFTVMVAGKVWAVERVGTNGSPSKPKPKILMNRRFIVFSFPPAKRVIRNYTAGLKWIRGRGHPNPLVLKNIGEVALAFIVG